MTNQQHPITPPEELVLAWASLVEPHGIADVFASIAQWGADQELKACCEWIKDYPWAEHVNRHLLIEVFRSARRPKPPSLKDEALEWLTTVEPILKMQGIDPNNTIRRALEQLDD